MVKGAPLRVQQCFVVFECCLWKDPLKGDFLEIILTTFFGVCNFGNISAINVTIFLKMFKT